MIKKETKKVYINNFIQLENINPTFFPVVQDTLRCAHPPMYHGVNATNSPKDYPKYSPGFVVVSLLLELLPPQQKKKYLRKVAHRRVLSKTHAKQRCLQNTQVGLGMKPLVHRVEVKKIRPVQSE